MENGEKKICPQCGNIITQAVVRCPRCYKLLLTPCSGSCSSCKEKGKCQG